MTLQQRADHRNRPPGPPPSEWRSIVCVVGSLLNVFIAVVNPHREAKQLALLCICLFALILFIEILREK